ncbi:hypothetical protein [Streptomyces sp. NPDC053431]|uniref:hypothetical protein n=1 Tax=Streptomyces sp. NPDC053431 TaxID=3365703 RepID=UPI0037D4E21A
MELLPTPLNRIAHTALGGAPAVAFVMAAVEGTRWAGAAALLFLPVAVRGWWVGVRCERDRLVVRGFLWTRRIERARIGAVTGFPAVRWTSRRGGRRWTPVLAFMGDESELGGSYARKRENVARLRR